VVFAAGIAVAATLSRFADSRKWVTWGNNEGLCFETPDGMSP
jgi:hypothetical protein